MIFRLTAFNSNGDEYDVTVQAQPGDVFGAIVDDLNHLTGDSTPYYIEEKRLSKQDLLGIHPLLDGAIASRVPSRKPRESTIRLYVTSGPDSGNVFPLARGETTLGREQANIRLHDPDLSRTHAALTVTGQNRVTLTDLGSTNGTWLEGTRITSASDLPSPSTFSCGSSVFSLRLPLLTEAHTEPRHDGTISFNRPPRFVAKNEPPSFTYPTAPTEPHRFRIPWIMTLAPALLAAGVYLWAGSSELSTLLLLLTPAMMLINGLMDRLGSRRRFRRENMEFCHRLTSVNAQISQALTAESERRRMLSPDLATLADAARYRTTSLWERRLHDPDALEVRLGLANVPSEISLTPDTTARPMETPKLVCSAVPVTIPLRGRGPVGISGPHRYALARSLALQIAALHSPRDIQIVVESDYPERWKWIRFIPHCEATPREHIILFLDDADTARKVPEIRALLQGHSDMSVICIASETRKLPEECLATVDTTEPPGSPTGSARLTTREGQVVSPLRTDLVTAELAEAVARDLAPLRDPTPTPAQLPARISLTETIGKPDSTLVTSSWNRQLQTRIPLGKSAEGTYSLDLAADGPHFLVAGTTGAGKSELLQCLIVSTATLNSPEQVGFLLVDYKGGAAFADCERLPHVLDCVTDLDPRLTQRALESLRAEVHSRERALAQAGLSDVNQLAGKPSPYTPERLLVIVDEFATLAGDLPDFLHGLVDIARRGRSLGIHLILATQRPAGVLSQEIRANMSTRICLRVADSADSLDVVNTESAVHISRSTPGRALIRRPDNLDTVQIAHLGGPYHDAPEKPSISRWNWPQPEPTPDAQGRSELAQYVETIRAAHAILRSPIPQSPLIPPLPERISTDECRTLGGDDSETSETVPFGAIDDPAQQRRCLLQIDLNKPTRMVITGRPGSGRTSTLQTIAYNIVQKYPPHEAQLAIVDCSPSETLRELRSLPHTRAVASLTDPDHILYTLTHLVKTATAGREEATRESCHTVVLLDSWEDLIAHCGAAAEELCVVLSRGRTGANTHLIVTGDRDVTTSALWRGASHRLLLAQSDPDLCLLGGLSRQLTHEITADNVPPGRGFLLGRQPQEVQVAYTATRSAKEKPPARMSRPRLTPLPRLIRSRDFDHDSPHLPLGVSYTPEGDDHATISINALDSDARLLITGPPRSGRSSVLAHIARNCLERGKNVIAFAPRASPLSAVEGVRSFGPGECDTPTRLPADAAVVIDDCELLVDTPVDHAISSAIPAGQRIIAAGTTEDLLPIYKGFVKLLRRNRHGVVLHPRRHDGELFSVRLAPALTANPGRGVYISRGDTVPIQLFSS